MMIRRAAPFVLALTLTGCGDTLDRLANLGDQPALTKLHDPTKDPGYTPVTMPVPTSRQEIRTAGSIWEPGARAFFKDQRASRVGDVLTVSITINDSAKLANQTQGNRADSESLSLSHLLGFESGAGGVLPNAFNPANAIDTANTHVTNGQAQVNRSEQINLTLAATVTQVLPNGNLVIVGLQEVRVNFDVRELRITGVVRASDIDQLNNITYDKIAEARISYGGHGQGTDLQQPRMGQQLIDILSPF